MTEERHLPQWTEMPDSVALITLNWEDIWYEAEEMDEHLTREECIKIFHQIKKMVTNSDNVGNEYQRDLQYLISTRNGVDD